MNSAASKFSAGSRLRTGFGIGCLSLATVLYEILLTRIFSVTLWYHFAFVAVSLAMFGLTVGAVTVFKGQIKSANYFASNPLPLQSLYFALSSVFAVLFHLYVPIGSGFTPGGLTSLIANYLALALPLYCSGVCICFVLSKYSERIGSLYAADLVGAGLSTIVFVISIRQFGGPASVMMVCLLGSLAGLAFCGSETAPATRRGLLALAALCIAFFALGGPAHSPLKIAWVKGQPQRPVEFEKWNEFSRITVEKIPDEPFGWGFSAKAQYQPIEQLYLSIDDAATTPLTRLHAIDELRFLEFDVTNIVHYLQTDARVLVIGAGGGRDILTAKYFGQQSVKAVEMNGLILSAVNEQFREFTGNLPALPNVEFVHDEARSYVRRSVERYDIVQVSMVDTFAATAAGAMSLTENSIYTLEGWQTFYDRLSDTGILSFARWYTPDRPVEAYRMAAMAATVLKQNGIADPTQHLFFVSNYIPTDGPNTARQAVVTMLLSKQAFSETARQKMSAVAQALQFKILAGPHTNSEPVSEYDLQLQALAAGDFVSSAEYDLPPPSDRYDLTPPTDDKPFFFNFLDSRRILRNILAGEEIPLANGGGLLICYLLLVVCSVLAYSFIIIPARTLAGARVREHRNLAGYFALIGLGFMFVELSQIQRFSIFLGHPTYGFTVVLCSLLIACGVGSYCAGRMLTGTPNGRGVLPLLAILAAYGIASPLIMSHFSTAETAARIACSAALLFVLGAALGTALPQGMTAARVKVPALTPWLWSLNGAASVIGSVLGVILILEFGIAATYWAGVACYAVCFGLLGSRAGSETA